MNFLRAREVFPLAQDGWLSEIERVAPTYGIDTVNETASFLAQCGHETMGFTLFVENLNYSAERLMKVWPRRFPDLHTANLYARNPKALANKVYFGRMGNDQTGDGWRYRGRGAIMVTGRDNYIKAASLTGFDLLANPDQLFDPKFGVPVACAWWKASGLDAHDDDADARAETEEINGGEIGLRERQSLLDRLLNVLNERPT